MATFLKSNRLFLTCAFAFVATVSAHADVFNMPSGETSLRFVTVGKPGNAADTTGYGSVPYTYQMGTYDVTLAQYADFLNAVAKTDTYGLYNSNMGNGGGELYPFGIGRSGSPGSYSYSVTGSVTGVANLPVFDVSWGDAARFCNWLQNGQPTGTELSTTGSGAYTLNGGTSESALLAVSRNAGATYFIPSEDEWYKAAFFDPSLNGGAGGYWKYPTKSNAAPNNSLAFARTTPNEANYFNGGFTDPTNYLTPVGTFSASPGPFGTYDMGGDVFQWTESNKGGLPGLRGVPFSDGPTSMISTAAAITADPTNEHGDTGFRVVISEAVPEPGSLTLLLAASLGMAGIALYRRRRRAKG